MSTRALLVVASCVIVATACGGGGGGGGSSGGGTTSNPAASTVVPPSPGTWSGRAEFGTFELTVNSASSAISEIAFNFQSWQCGGVTRSGGVRVSRDTGWPIGNNQFSIQVTIVSGLSMSVQGSFSSATTGSGTWSANSGGTTCSGTWTASK